MSETRKDRTLRELHGGPDVLLLANAWDAGSARVIETLGAKAIATTSAGVAWTHGYPDGDALPVALLIATVAAIARVVQVPLTADVEGAYSTDPGAAAETIGRVVDAGAVGINLEDGAGSPELLCAKIEQAKRVAARRDVDLFINARTDVYLRRLAEGTAALDETIARGRRYRSAGCDGLFVPAVVEPTAIRAIVEAVGLPLNVLAWPGLPNLAELRALGVRRLSAGSGVALAAANQARVAASAFLGGGQLPPSAGPTLNTREMNGLFANP